MKKRLFQRVKFLNVFDILLALTRMEIVFDAMQTA
jgi:hypothetical protein